MSERLSIPVLLPGESHRKRNLAGYSPWASSMDYTVHGTLQARILEWVAFPFSRGWLGTEAPELVSGRGGGGARHAGSSGLGRAAGRTLEAGKRWARLAQARAASRPGLCAIAPGQNPDAGKV